MVLHDLPDLPNPSVPTTEDPAHPAKTMFGFEPSFEPLPIWQTDPARVRRIAVVCGRNWYVFQHCDPRPGHGLDMASVQTDLPDTLTLSGLIRLAITAAVASVWIIPVHGRQPCGEDLSCVQTFSASAAAALRSHDPLFIVHELSTGKAHALAGLIAQRRQFGTELGKDKGTGAPIGIYAPYVADAWGFAGKLFAGATTDQKARAVASAVALAAFTLKMQLRFSPSYTGLQIVRQTLAAKKYAVPPMSATWHTFVREHLPSPIQWARPILPDERGHAGDALLHSYDRISSYVASAREMPVGDPIPAPWPYLSEETKNLPGIYHVMQAIAPDEFDPDRMPGPFYDPRDGQWKGYVEDVWAWEPQIRFARKHGWILALSEGYYWPRSQRHDVLREWQRRVWAATQDCRAYASIDLDAAQLATALVKRLGVATIGRFLQSKGKLMLTADAAMQRELPVLDIETDDFGDLTGMVAVEGDVGKTDLIQPHWWATDISNANERVLATIYASARYDTAAAYVDELVTLDEHSELYGGTDGQQLGKFRLKKTVLATSADVDALNTSGHAQNWIKRVAHLPLMQIHSDETEAEGHGADDE